MAEVKRNST